MKAYKYCMACVRKSMNDNQIKCFLEAATCLNFTTAARRLFITQPTLSRQIQNLESELNTKLFTRVNNSTALTAEGEALFKGLEPLYKDMSKLFREIKSGDLKSDHTFNVGIAQELILDERFIKCLNRLHHKYPELIINIDTYDYRQLREGLQDESLDMVIAVILSRKKMIPDFELLILANEEPYLAIESQAPYSEEEMLDIDSIEEILDRYPIINVEPGHFDSYESDPVGMLEKNIGWRRQEPPKVRYIDVSTGLPLLIGSGLGVALTHYHSFISVSPCVKMLPIQLGHTYDIGVSYVKNRSNIYIADMVKWLKEET